MSTSPKILGMLMYWAGFTAAGPAAGSTAAAVQSAIAIANGQQAALSPLYRRLRWVGLL